MCMLFIYIYIMMCNIKTTHIHVKRSVVTLNHATNTCYICKVYKTHTHILGDIWFMSHWHLV